LAQAFRPVNAHLDRTVINCPPVLTITKSIAQKRNTGEKAGSGESGRVGKRIKSPVTFGPFYISLQEPPVRKGLTESQADPGVGAPPAAGNEVYSGTKGIIKGLCVVVGKEILHVDYKKLQRIKVENMGITRPHHHPEITAG